MTSFLVPTLLLLPVSLMPDDAVRWKQSDGWLVKVELFRAGSLEKKDGRGATVSKSMPEEPGDKTKEPLIHRYDVNVICFGREKDKASGKEWVKMDFIIPEKMAPPGVTYRYRVSVDPSDGWARKVYNFRDYKPALLDEFGPARFGTRPEEGFPLEMIPDLDASFQASGLKSGYTLRVTCDEESGERKAVLSKAGKDEIVVRQVWRRGDTFWSEYERYVDGKLDLRARQVPRFQAPPKSVAAKEPGKEAKKVVIDEYLRSDKRLYGQLRVYEVNPNFHDLVARLRWLTALDITIADNLKDHDPRYGDVQFAGIQAWNLMEMLAKKGMEDGFWEKTRNGYRLTGKSLASPPPAKDAGATSPPPSIETGGEGGASWPVAAGAAAAAFGVGFALASWRARRKRL